MDGDSERLVGSVLRELIKSGELTREEVIVVSKIGYVQGDNLKQAEKREKAGHPYQDMVKYGEGIWHCIHPDYLADQLTLSLDRLGLATLEVCLLHNPEHSLTDGSTIMVYRRIRSRPTLRMQKRRPSLVSAMRRELRRKHRAQTTTILRRSNVP